MTNGNGTAFKLGTFAQAGGDPFAAIVLGDKAVDLAKAHALYRSAARRGAFRGSYVVTARYFAAEPDIAALTSKLEALVKDTAIAGGEIWTAVDPAGLPVSQEERLRGGDDKITGALVVDTLRQVDAEMLAERLPRELGGADIGLFRVLCSLGCDPGN